MMKLRKYSSIGNEAVYYIYTHFRCEFRVRNYQYMHGSLLQLTIEPDHVYSTKIALMN